MRTSYNQRPTVTRVGTALALSFGELMLGSGCFAPMATSDERAVLDNPPLAVVVHVQDLDNGNRAVAAGACVYANGEYRLGTAEELEAAQAGGDVMAQGNIEVNGRFVACGFQFMSRQIDGYEVGDLINPPASPEPAAS